MKNIKKLTKEECISNFGGRLVWITINKKQGYWAYIPDKK